MEYTKSGWDIILMPHLWHKRLTEKYISLIPGIFLVGLYNIIAGTLIFKDYFSSNQAILSKVFLLVLLSFVIGLVHIVCFAWPIADFCVLLAKKSEKYITPGFHVVFMKSFAYSYLFFIPSLLLTNQFFKIDNIGPNSPSIVRLFVSVLIVAAIFKMYWQIGILLRTISVKSKLQLTAKLMIVLLVLIWGRVTEIMVQYLNINAYRIFEMLEKTI